MADHTRRGATATTGEPGNAGREIFSGTIVALPTPFRGDVVDHEALASHVRWLVEKGVRGVSPCGTTGEAPVLSTDEQKQVIETVLEAAEGRVPVLAGTGSNDTRKTVSLSLAAARAGSSGLLVVTPYYNRPTQEGLYRHYATLAAAVDLPIVLYSVPGRTGTELAPETVARLSAIDGVVALKEAGGSVDRVSRIRSECDLPILSGDDNLTLPMLAVGARGVISVAANLVPDLVEGMIVAFEQNRVAEARGLHERTYPLTRALFHETNPAPVKAALALMGKMQAAVRAPLVEAGEATRTLLARELEALGIASAHSMADGNRELTATGS
jgi:4-hydroxy-tetrahydrodipicolinate synthase